jgi:hypothetical protein
VKCFDENLRIGGVYTKSYDRTMLTTSSLLTAYSDYSDGREDRPKFWSDEEYLAYLDGFANQFDLYRHIDFRTTVRSVTKCAKSGKWVVTICRGACHVWPHRSTFLLGKHVAPEIVAEARTAGAKTLKAFYDLAEEKGFENVKGTHSYDYYDHKTGAKVRMDPRAATEVRVYAFDHVAVCTGANRRPGNPEKTRFFSRLWRPVARSVRGWCGSFLDR